MAAPIQDFQRVLRTVGGGLWKMPSKVIGTLVGTLVDAVGGFIRKSDADEGAEAAPAGA